VAGCEYNELLDVAAVERIASKQESIDSSLCKNVERLIDIGRRSGVDSLYL
jgi:hypothetical protein